MPTEVLLQGAATESPEAKRLKRTIPARAESHFRALGLADPELSVVLTDDAHIQQLNAQWRDEDKPTDVLSFPLWEPDELSPDVPALGDIVISLEYAHRLVATETHKQRVAAELDVAPESLDWGLDDEVGFLLIHGLLHLVGYDHADPVEEAEMKDKERELWEASSSA